MTITLKEKPEDKGRLVVPPSIQRRVHIKVGDRVEFKATRGVITIVSKRAVPRNDEFTAAQRRVIDPSLRKSEEDIKKGRVYGPFDTGEAMAASMEASMKKLRAARRKAKSAR